MIVKEKTKSQIRNGRKSRRDKDYIPLEANRFYSRRLAAIVCDVSETTITRAYLNHYLEGYRVGRYIRHSGRHLLDWLEAGGRTGHSAKKEEPQ
jgi:hypothetical protein